MNTRNLSTSLLVATLAVALLIIGGGAALMLYVNFDVKLKWIIYVVGAMVGTVFFVSVRDKEKFLWTTLVLGFQINVHLYIFYGYSGTTGLAIGFPFLVALCLVAWYLAPATKSKIKEVTLGGSLGLPIAAVFATTIVASILSSEHFQSFSGLVRLGQMYFFFLVALNYIDSREKLEYTVKVLLVVLVIQSLIYFVQVQLKITFTLTGEVFDAYRGGEVAPRPGGTVATNPHGFASFVLPLISLATALFFLVRTNISGFVKTGLPALLGFIAIILTLTRAAWGSIAIGTAVIMFFCYRRRLLSHTKLLFVCGTGLLVVLLTLPLVLGRLAESPFGESYDERAALMQMAIEIIKAEPFFGVGPSSYRSSLTAYLPYELLYAWKATVHNHYLLRAAETGIFGLIAFLTFLYAAFAQAYRVSHLPDRFIQTIGIGILGALAALSFEMVWDTSHGYANTALLWFSLGILGAAERLQRMNPARADSAAQLR